MNLKTSTLPGEKPHKHRENIPTQSGRLVLRFKNWTRGSCSMRWVHLNWTVDKSHSQEKRRWSAVSKKKKKEKKVACVQVCWKSGGIIKWRTEEKICLALWGGILPGTNNLFVFSLTTGDCQRRDQLKWKRWVRLHCWGGLLITQEFQTMKIHMRGSVVRRQPCPEKVIQTYFSNNKRILNHNRLSNRDAILASWEVAALEEKNKPPCPKCSSNAIGWEWGSVHLIPGLALICLFLGSWTTVLSPFISALSALYVGQVTKSKKLLPSLLLCLWHSCSPEFCGTNARFLARSRISPMFPFYTLSFGFLFTISPKKHHLMSPICKLAPDVSWRPVKELKKKIFLNKFSRICWPVVILPEVGANSVWGTRCCCVCILSVTVCIARTKTVLRRRTWCREQHRILLQTSSHLCQVRPSSTQRPLCSVSLRSQLCSVCFFPSIIPSLHPLKNFFLGWVVYIYIYTSVAVKGGQDTTRSKNSPRH